MYNIDLNTSSYSEDSNNKIKNSKYSVPITTCHILFYKGILDFRSNFPPVPGSISSNDL